MSRTRFSEFYYNAKVKVIDLSEEERMTENVEASSAIQYEYELRRWRKREEEEEKDHNVNM